jgi:TetR/AcrR family transcriptional repressor of nem operon
MEERPRSREEAKRETREALLLAGITEFSERGLAEPSLDAICSRAGYTRGAFYVHFRDRDDFISAVMEQVLGDFLDAIIATGDQERDLEHTVTRFMDALTAATSGLPHHVLLGNLSPAREGSLKFHRVLEASARSPEVRERFAALLQGAIDRVAKAAGEGQIAGTVRTDVETQQVGALLVGLALGSVNALEIGISFDPEGVREAVLSLLRPRDD